MSRVFHIYIVTNRYHSVLYTGVTSNLRARIRQHKSKHYPDSFTARYNASKLVYYEEFPRIMDAIKREKQIKAGSRKKKLILINTLNPDWNDLSLDWDAES